jgi:hypothetical protein
MSGWKPVFNWAMSPGTKLLLAEESPLSAVSGHRTFTQIMLTLTTSVFVSKQSSFHLKPEGNSMSGPVVSKLLYDWWSVSQSVCLGVESTLGLVTRYYFLSEGCYLKFAVLFLWGALSDERTGLNFAVQSLDAPSHAEPLPYFAVSSETPPTLRARFPYLYPPGTGWPSYTPGLWVPFTSPLTTPRVTVEVFWPISCIVLGLTFIWKRMGWVWRVASILICDKWITIFNSEMNGV